MQNEIDVIEAPTPNQETESPMILKIAKERSEPGQRKAEKSERPAPFNPQHDPVVSQGTKQAKPTLYHAQVSYITRKGVTKQATISAPAHSQAKADVLIRNKIMSNGLRQTRSITGLTWLDKAPRKTPKATISKPKAVAQTGAKTAAMSTTRATTKSRSASRGVAVVATPVAQPEAPVVMKLGFWSAIPAVFAAAAGLGYGIAKGTFSNK